MTQAFELPETWSTVRLVLIRPSGWVHCSAVAEVMQSLMHGFRALGIDADIAENEARAGAVNIVFLAFYLKEHELDRLPANAIIYNLEQVGSAIGFLTPGFRSAIARYRVWDYSERNRAKLAPLVGHRRHQVVPIGYVPALTRIPRAQVQDIDVLFYGDVNDRRRAILAALERAGLRLHTAFGVYGAERDALIARSKVVLNIHAHETRVLEVVRISYLLANRKAVVTEMDDETEVPPDLRTAVAGVSYDRLVAECVGLVHDAAGRERLEDRGYAIFQKFDLVPILRRAITDAEQVDREVAGTSPKPSAIVHRGS